MSSTRTPRRVAIVTGASGGIGRETAKRLAADGLAVVVHYAGNADKAADLAAEITSDGGSATAVQADVGDAVQVTALFDAAETAFGGVDVVVHAAGVMILSPLADIDFEDFDRMMHSNLRGTFLVAQQAARRVRGGGTIINFSSSVTRLRQPNYSAYAATKAAVEVLTPILAKELQGKDVTVNAVAPGPVDTPLFTNDKSPEEIDGAANATPLGRLGKPADIAETISYLASPHSRWVNAQTIFVNGGIA